MEGFHGRLEPVHLPHGVRLSAEEFWQLCQMNRDWRFERSAEGDIVIMPPTGGLTGARNIKIAAQLVQWADRDGTGVAFDSSTGFELPNGATRSPDAAWVSRARLQQLADEEKERFLPLCPEFVLELRSRSDKLADLQSKMREYCENGARLGWLIDPVERCVYVFRRSEPVERLEKPERINGDSVLPGFVLELGEIWDPGI
jgi:Uma2 family endonuclease